MSHGRYGVSRPGFRITFFPNLLNERAQAQIQIDVRLRPTTKVIRAEKGKSGCGDVKGFQCFGAHNDLSESKDNACELSAELAAVQYFSSLFSKELRSIWPVFKRDVS